MDALAASPTKKLSGLNSDQLKAVKGAVRQTKYASVMVVDRLNGDCFDITIKVGSPWDEPPSAANERMAGIVAASKS